MPPDSQKSTQQQFEEARMSLIANMADAEKAKDLDSYRLNHALWQFVDAVERELSALRALVRDRQK